MCDECWTSYIVDRVDDDCWDLYVSEDYGYTWEFYNWYSSEELADVTGMDLMESVVHDEEEYCV